MSLLDLQALMSLALICAFAMWWPALKKLDVAAARARSATRSIDIIFDGGRSSLSTVPICPYKADPPTRTNALPALRRWRERVLGLASRTRRAPESQSQSNRARADEAKPKKKIKTVPPPRAPRPAPPRKIKGVPTDDAPTAMWIVAPELDFVVQRPQW